MTDAVKKLFELLAKKEKSGSDYTGTVTRVEGNTAFVQLSGADITDTPVSMSIGASPGDSVRVRVADGRAWLVGNDTSPPTSAKVVTEELEATNAHINELETENITGKSGWINLKEGKFSYGNGALSWNGVILKVKGIIEAISGEIGNWSIGSNYILKDATVSGTTYRAILYSPASINSNTNAFAVCISTDGGSTWSYPFKVTYGGKLTATNADISGTITATSGNIGGFNLSSTALSTDYMVISNDVSSGNTMIEQIDPDETNRRSVLSPFGLTLVDGDGNPIVEIETQTGDGFFGGEVSEYGVALSNRYAPISQSDIRLKDNIIPSDQSGLELINQIDLYAFDWKENGKHQKLGFIADYLEEIDPHLAYGDDIKAVDTFYLQGYEVKAIQELSAKVEEQQKRIDALEEQIAELKALVLQKG